MHSRAGLAVVIAAMTQLAGTPATQSGEAPIRAGVGERFTYDVSFSFVHVGTADMAVVAMDTMQARPVWRAVLSIGGGIPLFHILDSTTSWFDTATFASRRFTQRIREGRYHADRDFRVDVARRVYVDRDGAEHPSVAEPLDDVSFVYYVRSLHLAPGREFVLQRYFQPEGNPVLVRVIRRERITVPAGTFDALVVEPRITTQGIFSKDGRAQLWFSDDPSHMLLQLNSKLSFGSINLYLKRITPTPTRGTTPTQ